MKYITIAEWAKKNGMSSRQAMTKAKTGRLRKYIKVKEFTVTRMLLPADLKASDVPDGRKTRWQKAAGKPL